MRTTSDLYKTLLADPAHVKESRLTIGGVIYEESQIVSLSTSEPLFAQDTVSIGGAVAREIDFAAFLDDSVPKRAQIIHEVRLVLGDEVSEWLQKGVYYINTRSRDPLTGVTTVHGFDAMLMAEQEWIPPAKERFPMSMKEAVELTAAALGLEIDSRTTFKTGNAYKVDYPVADADESEEQQAKGLSIRQMWRWVAAAHGGNFIINDVGQLRLVPLNALPEASGYLVTETGSPITFGGVRILLSANASSGSNSDDTTFVGRQAAYIEDIPAMEPIGKVILKVDDNNAYVSKSDTVGVTLEADCAYGSQRIADDLLAQLQGYVYRPVQAEDALIDPAAELGDGITISGVYTVLAQKDTLWDALSAADIGAPGSAEMESEFRFTSAAEMKFQYQLATTRSLIAKNSESVQILVERTDGVEQEISYIQVDLEGITQRVQDAEGNIGALELTATQLTAQIAGKIDGNEAQALIDLSLDGLTLSASNGATSSTITLKAGDTVIDSAKVSFTGVVTFSALGEAPGRGDTIINGGWIDTDTLFATNLMGEYIYLLDEDEDDAGTIRITSATSASAAVEILSYGALRLVAEDGAVYLEAGGESLSIDYVAGNGYTVAVSTDFIPNDSGWLDLGIYDYQWRNVFATQTYAEAAEADTSDRNKKNSITYDLDRYDPFFDRLLPAAFKLNNGTSGRYHLGLIAQDVERALTECGIPTSDFAGFIKIEDSYALRYGEFIALLIWQVLMLKARVRELEVKA